MVKKIFRREFVRSAKLLGILCAVTAGLALASSGFAVLGRIGANNQFVVFFTLFAQNAFTSGISAVAAAETVIIFAGVYKAFATDEAYLTFTLPVSIGDHVKGRYLSCLLWTFIVGAVNLLAYGMIFFVGSGYELGVIISALDLGAGEILMGAEICALVVVMVFYSVSQIFFAIIFGMTVAKKRKLGAIILTVIVMYVIEGVVLSALIAIATVVLVFATDGGAEVIATNVILFVLIVAAAGIAFAFYKIAYGILNKRLNVD